MARLSAMAKARASTTKEPTDAERDPVENDESWWGKKKRNEERSVPGAEGGGINERGKAKMIVVGPCTACRWSCRWGKSRGPLSPCHSPLVQQWRRHRTLPSVTHIPLSYPHATMIIPPSPPVVIYPFTALHFHFPFNPLMSHSLT